MAKLILHIGTEKTGTTSLQKFCALNRSMLARDGLFVPDFLGPDTHYRFPILFYDDKINDDLTLAAKFPLDSLRRAAEKEKIISMLSNEIRSNPDGTFIISSEHLQSRLNSGMIAKLQRLVDDLFQDVLIVVYLRDPLRGAVSRLSTAIKFGHKEAVLPKPSDKDIQKVFNHKQTLNDWVEAFGEERVKPRLFSRYRLKGGSIINDFTALLDIKNDSDYKFPPLSNESLSYAGMQVLSTLNKFGAQELRQKSTFKKLISCINKLTSHEPKYCYSRDEFVAYQEAFLESNNWLRETYFPNYQSLWGETLESPPIEDSQDYPKSTIESEVLCKLILDSYQ